MFIFPAIGEIAPLSANHKRLIENRHGDENKNINTKNNIKRQKWQSFTHGVAGYKEDVQTDLTKSILLKKITYFTVKQDYH